MMPDLTPEVITGIILIVLNVPFGWGGAFLCGYLGQKTKKKYFYVLSVFIYILSWGMLAAGIYLCGKQYARYVIDNYVVKYIVPTVVIVLAAAFVCMIVYRKKIFKSCKVEELKS